MLDILGFHLLQIFPLDTKFLINLEELNILIELDTKSLTKLKIIIIIII